MIKLINTLLIIVLFKYFSFFKSDISLSFIQDHLSVLVSKEIAHSIFGQLYIIVITITILRVSIYLGLLRILSFVSRLFSILGFNNFESNLIVVKILFAQTEVPFFFIKNKLSDKELCLMVTSGMSSTSISALIMFSLIARDNINTIFASHILGIFISILLVNLLFKEEENDNKTFEVLDPYDDKSLLSAFLDGISLGSSILIKIASVIIGISIFISMIGSIVPDILPEYIKIYLTGILGNEIILLQKFKLSKLMTALLINFTNIGSIAISSAILKDIYPKRNTDTIVLKSFLIALLCNIMKAVLIII